MVTMPPDWPGPILGFPSSSSARFQPTTEHPQFFNTPAKVAAHLLQSDWKSGLVMTAPPSVHCACLFGKASCTRVMASTVPFYPSHPTLSTYLLTSGLLNSSSARPHRS